MNAQNVTKKRLAKNQARALGYHSKVMDFIRRCTEKVIQLQERQVAAAPVERIKPTVLRNHKASASLNLNQ